METDYRRTGLPLPVTVPCITSPRRKTLIEVRNIMRWENVIYREGGAPPHSLPHYGSFKLEYSPVIKVSRLL